MPGFMIGSRDGGLPLIDCGIAAPGSSAPTKARGLVDTGATHCVATPAIIAQAGLKQVGTIPNTIVGGITRTVRTFAADVILVGLRALAPHSSFTYTVKDALLLEEPLSGYDMILGWDALHIIDLTFGRDGTFCLRFG